MSSLQGWKSGTWRLLREGIVIFLGVAAALAGQAWFESRSARFAERELLANLTEELAANDSVVLELAAQLEEQVSIAYKLADAFAAEESPERTATLAELAPQLVRVVGEDLHTAALDDAIGSGNLRLLRSPELRLELSYMSEVIRGTRESFESQRLFVENYVRPYALENLRALEMEWLWLRETRDPPDSRFPLDAAELGDSPYFENLVSYSIFKYRDVLGMLEELTDALASARAQVEQEVQAL